MESMFCGGVARVFGLLRFVVLLGIVNVALAADPLAERKIGVDASFASTDSDTSAFSDTGGGLSYSNGKAAISAGAIATIAAIVITPRIIDITEQQTTTYSIVLDAQPASIATIAILPVASNAAALEVAGTVAFNFANWDTPQTIVVKALADVNAVDEVVIISHRVEGADFAVADVVVNIADHSNTVDNNYPILKSGVQIDTDGLVQLANQFNGRIHINPNDYFTDPDGDDLGYHFYPGLINIGEPNRRGADSSLILEYARQFLTSSANPAVTVTIAGVFDYEFTIIASDSKGVKVAYFRISIVEKPSAPTALTGTNKNRDVFEGVALPIRLSDYFVQADGSENLTYTLSDTPDYLTQTSNTITINPGYEVSTPAQNVSFSFGVTASIDTSTVMPSITLTITVRDAMPSTNSNPVLINGSSKNFVIRENSILLLDMAEYFADAEGFDTLSFSGGQKPEFVHIEPNRNDPDFAHNIIIVAPSSKYLQNEPYTFELIASGYDPNTGGDSNSSPPIAISITVVANTPRLVQSSSPDTPIPDNAQSISDTITINADITISSIAVAVDIEHTYRGDVTIDLLAPNGDTIELTNKRGGGEENINSLFFTDKNAPTFLIDDALSPNIISTSLNGTNAKGDWTLRVGDDGIGDTGTFKNWTLSIYSASTTVGNQPPTITTSKAKLIAAVGIAVQPIVITTDNGTANYSIHPAIGNGLTFATTTLHSFISGTPRTTQGSIVYTITASNGFGADTSTVTISVRAAPALIITTTTVTVNKGGTVNYSVALNSQPVADITITLSHSNPEIIAINSEGMNSRNTSIALTFTSNNWNTPQTVYVGATNTDTDDNTAQITTTVSGEDYNYTQAYAQGLLAIPTLTVTVNTADNSGYILLNNLSYRTVQAASGRLWLDRNLGATKVATAATDIASYGYIYQWGRGNDGHQLRYSRHNGSSDANRLVAINTPSNSFDGYDGDWTTADSDYSERLQAWAGNSGTNAICPAGFQVPSRADVERDIMPVVANATDALRSFLKLPPTGFRNSAGALEKSGAEMALWTISKSTGSDIFRFNAESSSGFFALNPGYGFAVRCIGISLDINESGSAPDSTDAAIILRYLFGSRGNHLVATGNPLSPAQELVIQNSVRQALLDVDNSATTDTKDGTMILRYLLSKQNPATAPLGVCPALTAGLADSANCPRTLQNIKNLLQLPP